MDQETTTQEPKPARRRNSPSSSSAPPPDGAGDPSPSSAWETSLDAGGEAPPAVDTAALEEVLRSTEAPPAVQGAPAASSSTVTQPDTDAARAPLSEPSQIAPDRWSGRKLERAKPKELRARIRELEARVPPPAPAGSEAPPPALEPSPAEKLELLKTALAPSFRMAGGLLSRVFQSAHLEIAEPESTKLAEAWAPIALPHWESIVAGMPWAVALGTTYEIGAPKVEAALAERQARRKLAGADPSTAAVRDAAGE